MRGCETFPCYDDNCSLSYRSIVYSKFRVIMARLDIKDLTIRSNTRHVVQTIGMVYMCVIEEEL